MKYEFLVDTYASECLKVISVWSEFKRRRVAGAPTPAATLEDVACTSRWSISA